jgi:hypothetical protein
MITTENLRQAAQNLAKAAEALADQLVDGVPPLALAQALIDLSDLATKLAKVRDRLAALPSRRKATP